MARYKKEVVREVTVISCDLCDYEVEVPGGYYHPVSGAFNMCSLCGKDTCTCCTGEACEDGILCKECAVNHDFHYGEGVGIVNKETGEDVDWHMDKVRKESMRAGRKMWNTKKER